MIEVKFIVPEKEALWFKSGLIAIKKDGYSQSVVWKREESPKYLFETIKYIGLEVDTMNDLPSGCIEVFGHAEKVERKIVRESDEYKMEQP